MASARRRFPLHRLLAERQVVVVLRTKVSCPRCHTSWSADRDTLQGKKIKCLKCGERFVANGHGSSSAFVPVAAPFAPPPAAPPTMTGVAALTGTGVPALARPWAPPRTQSQARRNLFLGLSLGGLALFLIGGVALATYCFTAGDDRPVPDPKEVVQADADPFPAGPVPPLKKEAVPPPAAPVQPPAAEPVPPPPKAEPPRPVRPAPPPDGPPPLKIAPEPVRPVQAAPPGKQALINEAIDRGVRFVKQPRQVNDFLARGGPHAVGIAALPGLTLLECGVPKEDPAVKRIAAFVRARAGSLMMTYDISLTILFLDRVGEPRDRQLIQTLAGRLIAGQNEFGGWTYSCRALSQPENTQLLTFLRQNPPKLPVGIRPDGPPDLVVVGKPGTPLPVGIQKGKPGDPPQGIAPGQEDPLPKGIQGGRPGGSLPEGISSGNTGGSTSGGSNPALIKPFQPGEGVKKEPAGPGGPGQTAKRPAAKKQPKLRPDQLLPSVRNLPIISGRSTAQVVKGPKGRARVVVPGDDNSNSQFAMLALWVARRHDVPVERTMALVHKRYHLSQHGDGGWSYHTQWGKAPRNPGQVGFVFGSRPSMTCVGLLGLAMGHGSAQERRAAAPGGAAPAKKGKEPAAALADPAIQRGLKMLGTWVGSPTGNKQTPLVMDLYALWSVERVAVLYDLKTIGGKDWYGWAAEMLLGSQRPDGSWQGPPFPGSQPIVDTCFALLILKRANLVQDLSENLRLYIAITDPDAAGSPGSRK
jgi:hypothetical protein